MNPRLKNIVALTLPLALVAAFYGIALLVKDWDSDAQSSALMPFPLMLPMLVFNWYFERNVGKIDPWSFPALARWWIFVCTLGAAYLSSFLPDALLEATVLTTIISVMFRLIMVQTIIKCATANGPVLRSVADWQPMTDKLRD